MSPVDTAYVDIWDTTVGAVAWDQEREFATFEFDTHFLSEGLDLAPLKMPLSDILRGRTKYDFRALRKETYFGLPGLLSDALPDRFGHKVINAWLARQGRTPESFNPVERLCYTGKRAMGALEFRPVINISLEKSVPVEINQLLELVQEVVTQREGLSESLQAAASDALVNILRVGTSAGGNRPKAIIAMNDETKEVRSGPVRAPEGFDYWVLKFDGVVDQSLGDPAGYGRIEYAYHLMALDAGIQMNECRLLEEGTRAHFMTKRFDRRSDGSKFHLQSLCAIAHFDFNDPGAYSYEQAFQVNRELRLPYHDMDQLFRRMVFNVLARNQDDHTKNIAYLMDEKGKWGLSPAFDVIYSFNPLGQWTNRHQMTINGKRDNIRRSDLEKVGDDMGINNTGEILDLIGDVTSNWNAYADKAKVAKEQKVSIGEQLRIL
jgi:serine/threonine-protein kinase HipA